MPKIAFIVVKKLIGNVTDFFVFLAYCFNKGVMRNEVVFITFDHLGHFIIAMFLLFNVGVTLFGADVAVEPIAGMRRLDFYRHSYLSNRYLELLPAPRRSIFLISKSLFKICATVGPAILRLSRNSFGVTVSCALK